jgi:YVTN family beta-propeller protein
MRPSAWTPTAAPVARGPGPPTQPRDGPPARRGSARALARRRRARRRRLVAAGALVLALVAGAGGLVAWEAQAAPRAARPIVHTGRVSTSVPGADTTPSTAAPDAIPSSSRTLQLASTITGDISPKSVAASGTGLVFAQNMMYKHTMTVYNSAGQLLRTIPDSVDLTSFGVTGHPGVSKGAPVEAAFSPDHRYVYVSNYSMYGTGFGPEGSDSCPASNPYSDSFVYRVSTKTFAIDKVIAVGKVPKYVAVTPDGRYLLVSNWCSYDLSVVSLATDTEVARLPIGPWPRGIAINPASTIAYVAEMGGRNIAIVNLATMAVSWIANVGGAPRHLVMDPTGRYLYATLNADGTVAKIDTTDDAVVAKVATGTEPRSMAISPDGTALYVVNYDSNTMTKVSTATMQVTQRVSTPSHPIGITYDPATDRVWIAAYSGAILVYQDG